MMVLLCVWLSAIELGPVGYEVRFFVPYSQAVHTLALFAADGYYCDMVTVFRRFLFIWKIAEGWIYDRTQESYGFSYVVDDDLVIAGDALDFRAFENT